jgi:hypothetical protein
VKGILDTFGCIVRINVPLAPHRAQPNDVFTGRCRGDHLVNAGVERSADAGKRIPARFASGKVEHGCRHIAVENDKVSPSKRPDGGEGQSLRTFPDADDGYGLRAAFLSFGVGQEPD